MPSIALMPAGLVVASFVGLPLDAPGHRGDGEGDIGVALLHPRRPQASILGEAVLALGITGQGIPFGGTSGLTDLALAPQLINVSGNVYQVAAGQIDGAYLLTTKNYRSHVNRQQFIRFLAGLQLNKYRNLKSGRPRLQEGQVILTVKLKTDAKEELPLDFTFVKVEEAWRVDRITRLAAA